METNIYIKNMVCGRCEMVVSGLFEKMGLKIKAVELGLVTVETDQELNQNHIRSVLEKNGFELMANDARLMVERMKIALISLVEDHEKYVDQNVSLLLAKKINRDYSILSKLFSKSEGITIEKYLINIKVEKAKELIQTSALNFSEIAYSLGYKSSSHLARHFKTVSGRSMSEYKRMGQWERTSLDKIISKKTINSKGAPVSLD